MKILQINVTANKGSTGRIAEQIGSLIQKEGWKSIIAYGRDANESASTLYRIGNDIDVKIHGFYSLVFGRHGLASSNATKELVNFIKKESPDIIHLHNVHGYYVNYKLLFEAITELQAKVIWTLHDCWGFTGHCAYFSDINCNKWKVECGNCPKKGNYPKSLIFDNSKSLYNLKKKVFNQTPLHIVTVSNWLKTLVDESFLRNHNTRVIWNGVDSDVFNIRTKDLALLSKYNIENKKVLLAASTSWAKQKGYNDYIQLSALLPKDVVIVLIGLSDTLKKGLPSNIVAIDRTESVDELANWYNIADIVMNLSYLETFGLTSVEGFMCGKPTIVYNATASPELIINPIMGKIIPPGDIHGVYESVKGILALELDASLIRKFAVQNFDAKAQYGKYINLYRALFQ